MQEAFYKQLLEIIGDGVYFVTPDRKITYWNKGAERISGYLAEEVVGKSCADNLLRHVDKAGTQLCSEHCPLKSTMLDGQPREAKVFMHHKLGHRIPVTVRANPILNADGSVAGAVEVFTDSSKRPDLISELEHLRNEVLTDPMTRIGNRRYAEITMANLDHTMQESSVPFGVIMADIDHFKKVNDAWGHHVGDMVIQMVAQTLNAVMRKLDVACRWGGEEFVLFVPNVNPANLMTIAERLRMLVQNSWVDHEQQKIQVTASFGCAVSHNGEAAQSVVDRADHQLYRSKEAGRNTVSIADD